jgi:hypothetical protein
MFRTERVVLHRMFELTVPVVCLLDGMLVYFLQIWTVENQSASQAERSMVRAVGLLDYRIYLFALGVAFITAAAIPVVL